MKQFVLTPVVMMMFVLASGPGAFAQWSTSANFNTAVCTASASQELPIVVSDGSGGAIILWKDYRNGSDIDLYAQRLNSLGVAQWTSTGVPICTATGDQNDPTMIADGSGGAFITWDDARNGSSNTDIYTQRINSSGVVQWTANGVAICAAANAQYSPTIASDDSGGAIITWQDNRSVADIYAQRVNPSGVPQWTSNGVAVCSATGSQQFPAIVSDGSGGAIITWNDYRNSITTSDIYAQRVNPSGISQWTSNGVVVDTGIGNQVSPVIASDGAGGAIITWEDNRTGNYQIYAQRLDPSGYQRWTTTGDPICTASNSHIGPNIVADGNGGAIITWNDYRNTSIDIYAQLVNAAGAVQWTTDGVAICTATGTQQYPTLVSDGSGGAIITWEDMRNGSDYDVYAQRINAGGTPVWTANGLGISTSTNYQQNPTIVSDGSGGAIITWWDDRNSSADIYAQKVDRFGYLGEGAATIVDVKDISNDQGGKVSVMWSPSTFDAYPSTLVSSYEVFIGVTPSAANQTYPVFDPVRYAAWRNSAQEKQMAYLKLPLSPTSVETIYWESLGSVTAEWLGAYSFNASTPSDSGPQGIPMYYFMVRAKGSSVFWDSPADSGYSVDNLSPGSVTSIAAVVNPGPSVTVHWAKDVTDPDVGAYEVYRSITSGFTPSSANKIGHTSDTMVVDNSPVSGSINYYRVITVDIHGNQSVPSAQAVASGGALPIELSAFTAAIQSGNDVKLAWTTTSETNVYGFYVQRHTDASTQWTTVSSLIPGAGTSLEQHNYTWTDNGLAAGKYYYRLKQQDNAGAVSYSMPITFVVTGTLGVKDGQAPLTFMLRQNYPNPFNPTTQIAYEAPEGGVASLKVYNVLEQVVATLVNNEHVAPGDHTVSFDGNALPSGVYYYRITLAGGEHLFTSMKKMVLIK
ncbi:MAG TPA: T9SS type A sorting domain-containing protein [Bacteroidota bacterium]|nr:T9SS type A sorting domain-containing protein [Bacteroidota bacterium]